MKLHSLSNTKKPIDGNTFFKKENSLFKFHLDQVACFCFWQMGISVSLLIFIFDSNMYFFVSVSTFWPAIVRVERISHPSL